MQVATHASSNIPTTVHWCSCRSAAPDGIINGLDLEVPQGPRRVLLSYITQHLHHAHGLAGACRVTAHAILIGQAHQAGLLQLRLTLATALVAITVMASCKRVLDSLIPPAC